MSNDKVQESIEDTGPAVGVAATHIPAGGGTLGGSGEAVAGSPMAGGRDTDTGLSFGIGQSTSTGTLPTQGGSNLDGTDPEGTLQTSSRYGDAPPVGHISEYGDTRSEEDRAERAKPD